MDTKEKVLFIISIVCIIITYLWRVSGHNYYIADAYVNFFSPTIVVYSVCIFILFGMMGIKKDFSKLSAYTFEIYLFHTLVLKGVAVL